MRTRKGQDGRQRCRQSGGDWVFVVFRFVVLQVAITPVANLVTDLPPSGEDSPTPVPITTRSLANTHEPGLDEGGGSLPVSVTTIIPNVSVDLNSVSPGIFETVSLTSTNALESTTECVDNCTKSHFSESGTTEYASEQQSEISTSTEQSATTLGGFNSTKPPDSFGQTTTPLPSQSFTSTSTPGTSTLNSTSTTQQVTDGSTSVVDTSTIVDTTFSSHSTQPSTPGTNSPSATLSVSPVITLSLTSPSNIQTTESVSKTASSSTPDDVSTTNTSTDFIATTVDVNKSNSELTAQQWVGIGIAIAATLVLLGVALIFLTWLRTRHNLNKKPIITVSKMEYAQSNTLEKKTDPQWRKSLTMALQSMNTHIEVPTETDEEMQAVDNKAFEEESSDPKASNQDALHLTKV